jgi:Fic family protein
MKPYIPDTLPLGTINWTSHITKIGRAREALGRYDGMLKTIINPSLLLSPLMTQEAVLSSRIEGTQASFKEVLEYEADPEKAIGEDKINDIKEIINYRTATAHAVKQLESKPLSLNLIRQIHSILMDSVRGRNRAPGEFRKIQNWIGGLGSDISKATYIPPSPELMMASLYNWEEYIHLDDRDGLVQLALIKAQFEIIHPFLDGNGRIGRILIPLFLFYKNILTQPMFYLSSYLESNRELYYSKLKGVSENNDWDGWIDFFLQALIEQADSNSSKVLEIYNLYCSTRTLVPKLTRSQYAAQATDALFALMLFTIRSFAISSHVPRDSAIRIINILKNNGVLVEVVKPKGRRAGKYLFKELFDILK